MASIADLALGAQQPAQVDAAEHVIGRIDHIDVGEGLGQLLGLAHVVDHLPDRPERRHRHEIRLHETAGRLLRVLEVALQRGAIAGRDARQDLLPDCGLEAFQQIGRVVGLELGDGLGQQLLGQRRQQLVAHRGVELGEHLGAEGGAQRLDQRHALLRLQLLDQVGKVGRLEALHQRAHALMVGGAQRLRQGPRQLGRRLRSACRARLADGFLLHDGRSAWLAVSRAPYSTRVASRIASTGAAFHPFLCAVQAGVTGESNAEGI